MIENRMKHDSMSELKNQTTQNRILENKEKITDEANAEQQKSVI